jgi:putative membrane protein
MLSTGDAATDRGSAMAADYILAVLHHLLVFSLAGILAVEIALMRPGIGAEQVRRLGAYDIAYGVVAGLILIVGFARVFWGAKGSDYYFGNHYFWAKISAFVILGLISIGPTLRILDWRRQLRRDAAFLPPDNEVRIMRRLMHAEGAFLILVIAFAAAMARFAT